MLDICWLDCLNVTLDVTKTSLIQYRKTVGFSGIQTRIVGAEGEHADHLTTTAQYDKKLLK